MHPYLFKKLSTHGLLAIFALFHFPSREAETTIDVRPLLHQGLMASRSMAYEDGCGYLYQGGYNALRQGERAGCPDCCDTCLQESGFMRTVLRGAALV